MDLVGNSMTIGSATIATITSADLRLWLVALAGIAISILCNIPRLKQRKYEAQRSRIELCAECIKDGVCSASCVVEDKYRPKRCPLNNRKK
jgi:hypothetical protein